MKEQAKNPQDQMNEEKMQSTWKIIQSNNGKDDSKSQKKNGGIDQEDTRNVLKREDLKNKQRWTT